MCWCSRLRSVQRSGFVFQSQEGTDSESSSASSFPLQEELDPFTTIRDAVTMETQTLQSHSTDVLLSASQLQNFSRPDLEAQIREIAAREGVRLARTNPRAFTSITIASRRRSTSPPPPASPTPELLRLSELSTHTPPSERLPEAAAPSTPQPPSRSGHVSHVHLTLSPKSTSHGLTPPVTPPVTTPPWSSASELPPVGRRPSVSSPHERVGLAAPPERYRHPEREDPCTLHTPSDRPASQSFTARHRAVASPRPQTTEAPGRPSLEHGCRLVC